MNKAELLARIEQIKTEMDNAIKQHTALVSHLNECNYWLDKLAKWEELESKRTDYAVGVVGDEVDAEEAE